MKAIILAAGKGSRLGLLTGKIPKPMLVINKKPILQHNIELCKHYGIRDIFINVHHLPRKIIDYFGSGDAFGVRITYSIEKDLLGTAGAVKKISEESWKRKKEPFFVLYGDNISAYNLHMLEKKFSSAGAPAVIAFHYRENTANSGAAEFAENLRVSRFIEKPKPGQTHSHWVNAGIYYLAPGILDHIPRGFSDFARDIFPGLLNKNIPIFGVCEKTPVYAFDSLDMYRKHFPMSIQR